MIQDRFLVACAAGYGIEIQCEVYRVVAWRGDLFHVKQTWLGGARVFHVKHGLLGRDQTFKDFFANGCGSV